MRELEPKKYIKLQDRIILKSGKPIFMQDDDGSLFMYRNGVSKNLDLRDKIYGLSDNPEDLGYTGDKKDIHIIEYSPDKAEIYDKINSEFTRNVIDIIFKSYQIEWGNIANKFGVSKEQLANKLNKSGCINLINAKPSPGNRSKMFLSLNLNGVYFYNEYVQER